MSKSKKAFTIIELTLSLTFISILLISIALTVIQMAGSYNKGILIKYITNAGVDISSDLQKSIAASKSFDPDPPNNTVNKQYITLPYGGRLCLGSVNYIWNYGTDLNGTINNANVNAYVDDPNTASIESKIPIRFIKVSQTTVDYCFQQSNGSYPDIIKADSIDLLSAEAGDRNIAVHSFKIDSKEPYAVDDNSGSRLYTITFILGTNNSSALTTASPPACIVSGAGSDLNYCQIQEFRFTVASGNIYKQ